MLHADLSKKLFGNTSLSLAHRTPSPKHRAFHQKIISIHQSCLLFFIYIVDGKYSLETNKSCSATNGASGLSVNTLQFRQTWADGSISDSINGTLSFRFHLYTENLAQ